MMSVCSVTCDSENKDAEFNPRLCPRIHPRVQNFLNNKDLLFTLVEKFGSPLNIMFPQNLDDNINNFIEIYKKNGIRGKIYYVTKPCKSKALIRQSKNFDIGIDVSSKNSLQTVLDCGWTHEKIVANGPKNIHYLTLCIKKDILINVDNIHELEQIIELKKSLGGSKKVSIGIRLGGFESKRMMFTPRDDTFGINIKELDLIIGILKSNLNYLDFEGFSFHLATSNDELRLTAIESVLLATFRAKKSGLNPRSINIGGGFPIMYADVCSEWFNYVDVIKKSVLGEFSIQTWDSNGLGFRSENGKLAGGQLFLDHAPFRAKGEALDFLLSSKLPEFGNATFSNILRDSLLRLNIEPGKSMLDQCGITLGEVMFTKESMLNEILVGVDMNRTNIQSVDQKQLIEPIVIYKNKKENIPINAGVYYMGNLCLSFDILQYNKTYPQYLPKQGDIIAFQNTGAYLMDFVESESLMQPTAKKVAVTQHVNGWTFVLDDDYQS